MSGIRSQLKVGGVCVLFDLVIKSTSFAVLTVPKNEESIFETSHNTFAYHQH